MPLPQCISSRAPWKTWSTNDLFGITFTKAVPKTRKVLLEPHDYVPNAIPIGVPTPSISNNAGISGASCIPPITVEEIRDSPLGVYNTEPTVESPDE